MKEHCPLKWCDKGHKNLREHYDDKEVAKVIPPSVVKKAPEPAPVIANAVANVKPVIANEKDDVANTPMKTRERVAKWRKAHREEYNLNMREYRRSHPKESRGE